MGRSGVRAPARYGGRAIKEPLRLLLLGVPGSLPGRGARSGEPLRVALPSPVKFLLAPAIGLAWSLLTYEACVRRTWIGRWLRGGAPRVPSVRGPCTSIATRSPGEPWPKFLIRKPFSEGCGRRACQRAGEGREHLLHPGRRRSRVSLHPAPPRRLDRDHGRGESWIGRSRTFTGRSVERSFPVQGHPAAVPCDVGDRGESLAQDIPDAQSPKPWPSALPRRAEALLLGRSGQRYRSQLKRNGGTALQAAASVDVQPVMAGDVPAEWLIPPEASPRSVILYSYGGAWTLRYQIHRRMVAHLCRGRRVLGPGRGLSPRAEHPFPAALEDCRRYRWLLKGGSLPRDIVIAGNSAGANPPWRR